MSLHEAVRARTPAGPAAGGGPRGVLGSSRAGYFTVNASHFDVAAACASVLATFACIW